MINIIIHHKHIMPLLKCITA